MTLLLPPSDDAPVIVDAPSSAAFLRLLPSSLKANEHTRPLMLRVPIDRSRLIADLPLDSAPIYARAERTAKQCKCEFIQERTAKQCKCEFIHSLVGVGIYFGRNITCARSRATPCLRQFEHSLRDKEVMWASVSSEVEAD